MKKALPLFILIVMSLLLSSCGNEKAKALKIPDVFGISYTDAITILEDEGFEVKAVETNVDNISEKLLYPLEKVDKGTVFKVDDYILDNLGNLTKNYDVFYDGEFISDDESVVIYYAKEDYVLKKNESVIQETAENDVADNETSKNESDIIEKQTTEVKNDNTIDNYGLGSDFKAAMDSYEDFIDEYVDFMKKYKANPDDLSLLTEYTDYLSKYAEYVEDFEKWEDEELNAAEIVYYTEVQARVSKKLIEVAS